MHTLSFTGARQVRFPAPDVARGFMLALIALANVPFWIAYFPETPQAGHAALEAMNGADQWWYLARTMLVDRRAYPLFSILFGFGMAIMASRTMERERRAAMETFTAEEVAGWHPVQRQIVEENVERYARRTASRLIRRRGWWMLAFGLVHAVFFAGDIIGAYGLVAVVFAEVIVMRRAWVRVLVGVFIGSLSLLGIWSMAAFMGQGPMMLEVHDPVSLDAGYPLVSVASWLIATPMTVLTALVVPCVMIGVGVARWGLLQDPRGRGALLSGIAACGLGIGALGGLPFALMQLDWAFLGSAAWSYPLFHASGVAGACGWLALLALVGGGPREQLGRSDSARVRVRHIPSLRVGPLIWRLATRENCLMNHLEGPSTVVAAFAPTHACVYGHRQGSKYSEVEFHDVNARRRPELGRPRTLRVHRTGRAVRAGCLPASGSYALLRMRGSPRMSRRCPRI